MDSFTKFIFIMIFYVVISNVIGPLIGYFINKSLDNAGHGFAIGSAISVILWYTVGRKNLN